MPQHTARLTSKGQVTVPAEVRRLLHLRPKDKVAFLIENENVRLVPARSIVAQTAGILRGAQPRLTLREEQVVAEEGMAEEVEKQR